MKSIATALLTVAALAAPARGQVLDQMCEASGTWLYCFESVNVWQQQIRVGIGGRLDSIELRFRGSIGSEMQLRLRRGDGWNAGPAVWSGSYTKPLYGIQIERIDVSEANFLLGAGETFVLEVFGDNTDIELYGRHVAPADGPPAYPEPLFLSGPGCYGDCGYNMGFKTYMDTGLTENYCVSIPNSTGLPAQMSSTGSLSVLANDLVLHVDQAVPGQPGMFFYGPGPNAALFGNGVLCVTPGVGGMARLPITMIDGAGHMSTSLDMTLPPTPASQITAASTWYFQAWYRDPAAGGSGILLSDGLQVSFLP